MQLHLCDLARPHLPTASPHHLAKELIARCLDLESLQDLSNPYPRSSSHNHQQYSYQHQQLVGSCTLQCHVLRHLIKSNLHLIFCQLSGPAYLSSPPQQCQSSSQQYPYEVVQQIYVPCGQVFHQIK